MMVVVSDDHLSSFWLLEDTGLKLYGDCGSFTMLCLFGLGGKAVKAKIHGLNVSLSHSLGLKDLYEKRFRPSGNGAMARRSSEASLKSSILEPRISFWPGKSQKWRNDEEWEPSTRMSRLRGCSPWHLPQLLSQTSSLGFPCPKFKIRC